MPAAPAPEQSASSIRAIASRLALVALLVLATGTTLTLDPHVRRWLAARIENPILVDVLAWTLRISLWLLPCLLPRIRAQIGNLALRWTRTAFLIIPWALVNFACFRGYPDDFSWMQAVFVSMMLGIWEELLFRGYALIRYEIHPRLAIVISALGFALLHCPAPWTAIATVFFAGIAFGIVRVASGSLGLCMLLHALVDVTAGPEVPEWAIISVTTACTIATIITLWRHPKLRKTIPPTPAAP